MPEPTLCDAYAAVDRAREKARNLRQTAIEFGKRQRNFGEQVDSNAGTYMFTVQPEEIPQSFAVATGEVLTSNLRPALDYLVYALAWLDSGDPQKGTQFPICDTPEQFEAKSGRWLKGLNDTHIAALRQLQPFEGGDHFRLLRDLSNPAKHRHLTVLTVSHETLYQIIEAVKLEMPSGEFPPPTSNPDDPLDRLNALRISYELFEELTKNKRASQPRVVLLPGDPLVNSQVHVHLGLNFFIGFKDGPSPNVDETLIDLQAAIRQTLDQFQSDFKG